jgi:hypothetical protein
MLAVKWNARALGYVMSTVGVMLLIGHHDIKKIYSN